MIAAGGFPPVDIAILGVVGVAVALWSLGRASTLGRGALLAGVAALGYFGALYAWSARFGVAAYVALVATQALFLLPVGAVAARRSGRAPWRWIAAVTGVWVLVEAARARIPLGGFEWGQLGTTAHGLPLLPAASIAGSLGLTALVVAVAGALVTVVLPPGGGDRWRAPTAVLVAVLMAVVLGSVPWTQPTRSLTVASVQVDPVCPGRYAVDCPNERQQLSERHADATRSLDDDIDLVLWGEGVLRGAPEEVGQQVLDQVGQLPAPVLAGVTTPLEGGRFANRNVLLDEQGVLQASYAKRQPVPFGEYVPARRWLSGIGDVGRLVPADMDPGGTPGQLRLPGPTLLGTVSSWEVTFSRLVRDTGRLGQAVVTLTTQSTYERAAVSDQLLRAAQVRAAELQKPVLVTATTGRSAVIDAGGQQQATTRLYGADVAVTEVQLHAGDTPYARWGDLPAVVVAVGLLAASLWTWPARRPGRRAPGLTGRTPGPGTSPSGRG